MNINDLKKDFFTRYGKPEQQPEVFFSPGRVNLIGEHTDYNGGYVFPCALSFGTYLLVRKTGDNNIKFASINFPYTGTITLSKNYEKQGKEWVNYPLGVLVELAKKNIFVAGMEMLYYGDIPNGAGLSSSASIEMVTAFAMNEMYKGGLDRMELVKLSQAAENKFVGVNCGIMDQFASGMGKKDHALMLKCDTLQYETVPVVLKGYKLVIGNTNKQRGLADSKYNERRDECEKAVEYISKVKKIHYLADLTMEEFGKLESAIPDDVVLRRARHVVSENQRVIEAVTALKKNDLKTFGQLMNASHDSLRDDYEVTGIELDTMVEEARKISNVLGSRMTGAGFGGCTVSVVADNAINEFIDKVGHAYKARTSLSPVFYVADIGDGSKKIES